MKKELKTLRSKNPKEYWKILNKGQKKKQPNISNDVLYDFSKNLNGAPDHDDVALSVLSFSNRSVHLHFIFFLVLFAFFSRIIRISKCVLTLHFSIILTLKFTI
jgi:hypothetical protein